MLKGAVAGWGAADGPWTGGGTKVRTPDDDDCQSMAHTTRPSMSLISLVRRGGGGGSPPFGVGS